MNNTRRNMLKSSLMGVGAMGMDAGWSRALLAMTDSHTYAKLV